MAKAAKKTKGKQEAAGRDVEVQRTPSRAVSPFEEMERLFESYLPRGWMRPFQWEHPLAELRAGLEGIYPRVDVVDRDDDVLIRAEIPGVGKEDLDVSMTDDTVTIKGSTSHEEKEEEGEYFRAELRRGAFSRTVGLPSDVDGSKAKASFKDGVLELTAPKAAKSKRRKIRVS